MDLTSTELFGRKKRKKINMKKLLIFIACLIVAFISCEKDSGPLIIKPKTEPPIIIPDTLPHEDTIPIIDTIVNYLQDIQPIFTQNCVVCHDQNHAFIDLQECCSWDQLIFSGVSAPYVDTLSPYESYLYIKVAGAGQNPPSMPPSGPFLSEDELNKIIKWIRQGAKNN